MKHWINGVAICRSLSFFKDWMPIITSWGKGWLPVRQKAIAQTNAYHRLDLKEYISLNIKYFPGSYICICNHELIGKSQCVQCPTGFWGQVNCVSSRVVCIHQHSLKPTCRVCEPTVNPSVITDYLCLLQSKWNSDDKGHTSSEYGTQIPTMYHTPDTSLVMTLYSYIRYFYHFLFIY